MLIMKNYTNMFIALLIFQLSSIRFPSIKKISKKGKFADFYPQRPDPFAKRKNRKEGDF